MWQVAERAGFEPAVLSHTAFRERHLKPLGHLSARESSKGRTMALGGAFVEWSSLRSGGLRQQVGAQVGRVVLEDARDDLQATPHTARGA
jgi:hypothetical protein